MSSRALGHLRSSLWPWGLLVSLLGLGCDRAVTDAPPLPPHRDCTARIWAQPLTPGAPVSVTGSWSQWVSEPLDARDDGWQLHSVTLPPGEYSYLLAEAGVYRLDPLAPLTSFVGDGEVSALIVEDCAVPAVVIDAVDERADGLTLRAHFLATGAGTPLDPASLALTASGGAVFTVTSANAATGAFVASASGLGRDKYSVSVTAADTRGIVTPPARAAGLVAPAAATWDEATLYQLVTDRFRGDGGAVLAAPPTPGSRAGGTLDGVRAELEKGTFEALGVTALWISPVYQNPVETRLGRDGHAYQGYHGYWPSAPRTVDPRLGGEAALRALIASAHRRGLRVLFDLVPNHVYETSERYQSHRHDGWFHDGPGACVCGDLGCPYSTDCWFADYLPDVREENADSMAAVVDDAVWWSSTFDADGVRIDAVPLMPRSATRRLAAGLRADVKNPRGNFVLGEVFTGPGLGGVDAIRYFLGPSGLDAGFDFPLAWALRDALARGSTGFSVLESLLAYEDVAYRGSGTVIPRMLGNHDMTRFASVAAGDDAGDPWTAAPAQSQSDAVYARMKLGLVALFTLPGMPVLYYGDEVALAGAGDPDSRRVLPGDDALLPAQRDVRALTQRLGTLRRCSSDLRTAPRTPLVATPDTWAYARGAAVIALSTAPTPITVTLSAPSPGTYVDALTGEHLTLPGDLTLPALGARVLLPESDTCL